MARPRIPRVELTSKAAELVAARKRLGLSQRALAEALDVDVMTVSRWERDVVTTPKMAEMAIAAIRRPTRPGRR